MRLTFTKTLVELADDDPRVVLLTGDLGFTVLEPFAERFPDRFFNVGVAEQNMVGVATGLAEAGFRPFVYSIVTFATLRPYEFIRNGPVLQELPVRIVGVGGGLEYGHNGPSHYGLEDIALMRVQPGMTVVAPADYMQARAAVLATHDVPGAIYFRLGKDDLRTVPGLDGRFELGRAHVVREGDDVVVVTMGSLSAEAVLGAELLAAQGVSATVVVVSSLSPPPLDDLERVLRSFPVVVTHEAHYPVGGVGALVSEVVAERGLQCRVVRCAVTTAPSGASGSERHLYERHGLSSDGLAASALAALDDVVPASARRGQRVAG